jgi:hypothetical protein
LIGAQKVKTLASRIWPSVLFNLSKNLKKGLDDAKVLNPKPFFLDSPSRIFFHIFLNFFGGEGGEVG